jgi:hypothetical protein
MTRIDVLATIHTRLADPAHSVNTPIDDPAWVSALTSMAPALETSRRGDQWVEGRSEQLGQGRTLFAVISRDQDGQLRVTAHIDASAMNAEWCRISEDILGRPRGTQIHRMDAFDLLHRTVTNEHDAAFHVSGLYLDARSGRIVIDLLDLDENDDPIPGTECGIHTLDGWQVH